MIEKLLAAEYQRLGQLSADRRACAAELADLDAKIEKVQTAIAVGRALMQAQAGAAAMAAETPQG